MEEYIMSLLAPGVAGYEQRRRRSMGLDPRAQFYSFLSYLMGTPQPSMTGLPSGGGVGLQGLLSQYFSPPAAAATGAPIPAHTATAAPGGAPIQGPATLMSSQPVSGQGTPNIFMPRPPSR